MDHLLKIAYDAGCRACLSDHGLDKQAGLSPAVLGALTGGASGAITGGVMPYVVDNGPFWDKKDRALRGALAGGLVGALGGGLGRKFLPAGGLSADLAETVPGVLAGVLASGNYDYVF